MPVTGSLYSRRSALPLLRSLLRDARRTTPTVLPPVKGRFAPLPPAEPSASPPWVASGPVTTVARSGLLSEDELRSRLERWCSIEHGSASPGEHAVAALIADELRGYGLAV